MSIASELIKQLKKRSYKKFDSLKLKNLKEQYLKNPYPKKDEMDEIAKNFSVKFEKIQNWYKTHRRNDMKRGCMKYQRKITFSKVENKFLMEHFLKNPYPLKKSMEDIANQLNCRSKNIKHWFTYKRKLTGKRKATLMRDAINKLMPQQVPQISNIVQQELDVNEKKPINNSFFRQKTEQIPLKMGNSINYSASGSLATSFNNIKQNYCNKMAYWEYTQNVNFMTGLLNYQMKYYQSQQLMNFMMQSFC